MSRFPNPSPHTHTLALIPRPAPRARTRAAIKASGGKIPLSYDYVIAAVRSDDTDTTEEVHASETESSPSTA